MTTSRNSFDNRARRRAIEIMETAISETTWTEKRIAFYHPDGTLAAISPYSGIAYSGVTELKKMFHLEDRVIEVTVTVKEATEDD